MRLSQKVNFAVFLRRRGKCGAATYKRDFNRGAGFSPDSAEIKLIQKILSDYVSQAQFVFLLITD